MQVHLIDLFTHEKYYTGLGIDCNPFYNTF